MSFLLDGYQTIIAFSLGAVTLREKEVQPEALDGGGPIDITTLRNTVMRTLDPKSLTTIDDLVFQASYDPVAYVSLIGMINVLQIITVFFPDATALAFWGWVDKFIPQPDKEGEFPLAEVRIHFSGTDGEGNQVIPRVVPADAALPARKKLLEGTPPPFDAPPAYDKFESLLGSIVASISEVGGDESPFIPFDV